MLLLQKVAILMILPIFVMVQLAFADADCQSLFKWKRFPDVISMENEAKALFKAKKFSDVISLKNEAKALLDKYRSHEDLLMVERCIQKEADELNDEWTNTHFQLVVQLNQVQEDITEVEKVLNEIDQIKRAIQIQEQAIQSIKLIYQSKLLEIPKAYLLLARKRRGSDISQQQLGRQLNQESLEYLEIQFNDHLINSSTSVNKLRVVSDFIEYFQGGRAQSFEFDPVTFLDRDRILHYIQVYRLYPLFPTKTLAGTLKPVGSAKKLDHVKKVTSEQDPDIPVQVKQRFQIVLQRMIKNVDTTNGESIELLKSINQAYYQQVSEKEKIRSNLREALRLNMPRLGKYPSVKELQEKRKSLQVQLNNHIDGRDLIVVTNPSELSQTTMTLEEQYNRIIDEAYKSLSTRAKALRAFKFYRVENNQLIEADAGKFYSKVAPIEYAMPFLRNTYRDEEGGLERLGVVLGLRVKLSHTGGGMIKTANSPSVVIGPSGLIWQDSDYKIRHNWESAKDYCKNLNLSGYSGWRLPAKEELGDLYMNRYILKSYEPKAYWSSTVHGGNSNFVWRVGFRSGKADTYDKNNSYYVRCVRGGQ